MLTAVLQASTEATGKGLELIADPCEESSDLSLSGVLPSSVNPFSFSKSGIALKLDFAASKIVALGIIEGLGRAVIVTKSLADQSVGCCISLAAQDLTSHWQSSFRNLGSFNLANTVTEALTFNTTINDLQGEIQDLTSEPTVKSVLPQNVSPWALLPPETPRTSGVWVFATVLLSGCCHLMYLS